MLCAAKRTMGHMLITYTVPDPANPDEIRERLLADGFPDVEPDDSAELVRLHIQCDDQDQRDKAREIIEAVVEGPATFDDEYGRGEDVPG